MHAVLRVYCDFSKGNTISSDQTHEVGATNDLKLVPDADISQQLHRCALLCPYTNEQSAANRPTTAVSRRRSILALLVLRLNIQPAATEQVK